jgi:hypothetical protein
LPAEAFRIASTHNSIDIEREQLVVKLVEQANSTSSVEVLKSDWEKFLARKGITNPEPPTAADETSEKRGRPRKAGWEDVLHELAAILWREIEVKGIEIMKQDAIVAEIHHNLSALGALGLPQQSTIQGRISGVRTRMEQLRERRPIIPKKE